MSLAERYRKVREDSLGWLLNVSVEDCSAQAMPDASPLKWHLAHTTWFFETFVLQALLQDYRPRDSRFRELFNSYYQQVSPPYPRAQRGLLTRPSLDAVLTWRTEVDEQLQTCLANRPDECSALIELGLQHEQQHQELMTTDLLALLFCNPLKPVALPGTPAEIPDVMRAEIPKRRPTWITFSEGVAMVGHDGAGFCFDNERPMHHQYLQPYALSSALVTTEDYLAFIDAGGYEHPSWWMAEGWDWVLAQRRNHPQYWRRESGEPWREFSLHGEQVLQPHRPAVHLSLFEADAYARWSGHRLPTEGEWEHAARSAPQAFDGLFDQCWQWTQSSYAPYPGFRIPPGAIGEYNGKFMLNQYVLRGASAFTPAGHARASYRNFFPAQACWQRTGLRLAKDIN